MMEGCHRTFWYSKLFLQLCKRCNFPISLDSIKVTLQLYSKQKTPPCNDICPSPLMYLFSDTLKWHLNIWQEQRKKFNMLPHHWHNFTSIAIGCLAQTHEITWCTHFFRVGHLTLLVPNHFLTRHGMGCEDKPFHNLTADWLIHFQSEVHFWWCHAVVVYLKAELLYSFLDPRCILVFKRKTFQLIYFSWSPLVINLDQEQ